ncbi:sensor histidine kinase [Pseudothauera rhizosphaerae]|uniref:PAS domain S-box protein n=1 Tax=Pseudothauera rhizosphaerae TaxID=2565932 RepID=A0A4S4AJX0_9RHOO|nr:histidine kinase [Pseudothauera rhizosphaerae]THF59203.1 PAS domain S-box protein [Pseudothauera rhizosphaerae]
MPIEFDPQRLPHLPAALGAGLVLVSLPLALASVLAPVFLLRWLPLVQPCGTNTLLALTLLGAAVVCRRHGVARAADGLVVGAGVLALLPLVQAAGGLYPADGVLRFVLDTRRMPDLPGYWPGRMSPFSALALLLAAICLYSLPRLADARGVKLWLVLLSTLLAMGLAGALGQWMDAPLLMRSGSESAQMGMVTALGVLVLALAMCRMAVGTPPVERYFRGRPDRSVFALSVVGLFAMLVIGGVLISGLLARVGLQVHRDALAESLRVHLQLAEAELRALDGVVGEARRRVESGALDWFVPVAAAVGVPAGSISIRIEAAAQDGVRRNQARLPLRGAGGKALFMHGGWWVESRHALGSGRGELVVEMPFPPLDLLSERVAADARRGDVLVCGRGGDPAVERCFPSRHGGRQAAQAPAPMVRALAGESGVAEVYDDRQRKVMVAYAPLAATGTAVVLEADVADLQAPLRAAMWTGVLVILLAALGGGGMVYRHVRPLIVRLSRTEHALNRAQALAHVGSWHFCARTGEITWSDETYRIFALPPGAPMTYSRFLECAHPDDRPRLDAAYEAALGGAPYDIEHRIVADGQVRWVRERAELEFDRAGRLSGAMGTVEDVTEQRVREAELVGSRQKLRDLAAYHEKLREEERAHIAREIHDELGQYLTALRMDAALLQLHFGEDNPALAQKVSGMKKLIDRTIKVVRSVASSLRPAALDLGLVSAAEWLVGEFRGRSGVNCTLDLPEHELALDDARATVVFRILQESLTNVSRHARAANVEVRIVQRDGRVVLEVRDDGVGFDPAVVRGKKTFGLMGIRERARMFGGGARFVSGLGQGTLLRVEMPLNNFNGKDR